MQAVNRYGILFEEGEVVMLADSPVLYISMMNQELKIDDIKDKQIGESGFMVLVTHVESGKQFKNSLDINWFKKAK